MTQIRTLYSLLFIIAFSNIGFAQPVFITSESNVDQTVNQIFDLYEAQITLSYDHVYNFVANIVEGSQPDDCQNPYPKIKSVNQNAIDFFWDSIPTAQYYEAAHLSLNTGAEFFTETSAPSINFGNLKGLVLFGFNTICEGNIKSASGIVIVDIDILFPTPPGEDNCDCELMASIPFNPATSNTQQAFPLAWPSNPNCPNSKYRIRVDGDFNGGSSPSAYSSEITFIHGKSSPNVIYLLPKCDKNALSSAGPLRAGGLDYPSSGLPYYNASFTHTNLILTVPPSDLDIKDIFVDVCTCKGKGKGKGKGRNAAINNPFENISLSPNPSSDQVQISLGVENLTDIKIEVYDLLGKRIETLTLKNQLAAGQHQLNVDVQSWPKGVYSFHLSSATQNKVLLFSKN